MAKNLRHMRNTIESNPNMMNAEELRNTVRDGLFAMTVIERTEFINQLEAEMRRDGLDIRAYLIPLGIPGRSPDELTPTEIAHLIRFLKINVSKGMNAIERAMKRFTAFSFGPNHGRRLAA